MTQCILLRQLYEKVEATEGQLAAIEMQVEAKRGSPFRKRRAQKED